MKLRIVSLSHTAAHLLKSLSIVAVCGTSGCVLKNDKPAAHTEVSQTSPPMPAPQGDAATATGSNKSASVGPETQSTQPAPLNSSAANGDQATGGNGTVANRNSEFLFEAIGKIDAGTNWVRGIDLKRQKIMVNSGYDIDFFDYSALSKTMVSTAEVDNRERFDASYFNVFVGNDTVDMVYPQDGEISDSGYLFGADHEDYVNGNSVHHKNMYMLNPLTNVVQAFPWSRGSLYAWDSKNSRPIEFNGGKVKDGTKAIKLDVKGMVFIRRIAFDSRNRMFALTNDNNLTFWNLETGKGSGPIGFAEGSNVLKATALFRSRAFAMTAFSQPAGVGGDYSPNFKLVDYSGSTRNLPVIEGYVKGLKFRPRFFDPCGLMPDAPEVQEISENQVALAINDRLLILDLGKDKILETHQLETTSFRDSTCIVDWRILPSEDGKLVIASEGDGYKLKNIVQVFERK